MPKKRKVNPLTAIHKRAKALRRSSPGSKWSSMIKEASREWNQGALTPSGQKKKARVSGTKHRKPSHHKPARHTHRRMGAVSKSHADGVDRKKVDITIGSVSQHLAHSRKILKEQIGWMEATKLTARTKKEKRELSKKIAEKLRLYKKLCE